MSNDTHSGTAAVFNAFIEASKALEELPTVKAELESTRDEHARTQNKLQSVESQNNFLNETVAALKAEIAQREAELAQATKSHADLAKVMDTIRGAVGHVATDLGNGVKVLADVATAGQSDADPTVNPVGTATEFMSPDSITGETNPQAPTECPSDPFPTNPNPPSDHTYRSAPTMTPASTPTEEQPQIPSPDNSHRSNSGPSDAEGREGADPIAATARSENVSSVISSEHPVTPTVSGNENPSETNPLPHSGRAYWERPESLDWATWESLGGSPPPWRKQN